MALRDRTLYFTWSPRSTVQIKEGPEKATIGRDVQKLLNTSFFYPIYIYVNISQIRNAVMAGEMFRETPLGFSAFFLE